MSLDAVGVVSENLKRSVEFYNLLGVKCSEVGGPDHHEGTTPSGVRLMIDSAELIKKLNPDWKKPTGSGVVLCFKQNSAQEVDEMYHKVTLAGFKGIKEPWDAFWGQRYSSLEDPDGNQIDIFAAL